MDRVQSRALPDSSFVTLRWREMDSNPRSPGPVSSVIAPGRTFVPPTEVSMNLTMAQVFANCRHDITVEEHGPIA